MNEDMIVEVLVPKEAPKDVRDKLFDAVADAAIDGQPEDRDWDVFVTAGPASGVIHVGHGGGYRARGVVRGILIEEFGYMGSSIHDALAGKIVNALIEAEKL